MPFQRVSETPQPFLWRVCDPVTTKAAGESLLLSPQLHGSSSPWHSTIPASIEQNTTDKPSYCRGAERLKKPQLRFQYTLRKCPDVGRRGKKRDGEGWRGDPALGLAPHTPGAHTGPAALSGPALGDVQCQVWTSQGCQARPAQHVLTQKPTPPVSKC